MRVIMSARDAWAVPNDVVVVENLQTASMMVRKIVGGNRDMLRRWRGSARPTTVWRGGIGAMGL